MKKPSKTKKIVELHLELENLLISSACNSYDAIARESGKYEGGSFAQIKGFRAELEETVVGCVSDLMDRIAGELNPSNDHPGAPVTMYYHRETGERIA